MFLWGLYKILRGIVDMKINIINYRVASGPGISGNLEKSGNFVARAKCQGKVREFRESWKSQGILT